MYTKLIEKLKNKGVEFSHGLDNKEFGIIKQTYGIIFPSMLQNFYQEKLPISKGFYNWRDFSKENICFIKGAIQKPVKEIIECSAEIDWNEIWGDEPIEEEKRKKIIQERAYQAPKLIPIFSHRYMADIETEISPIFSVCGTDIICFAKDLFTYFEIEFKIRTKERIKMDEIVQIPFWSDLL